ncbi:hypothetical protein [Rhizobium sp. WYJ-E13]|uniref:SLAC1 family transporter n=1 Tax=Rhizobium sp. WYJ-E13 TaxID=2849093 RepID=UPI0034675895
MASVLLGRLLHLPSLAEKSWPTPAIQPAPPAVGTVAYLGVASDAPGVLVHAMFGYALFQSTVLPAPWRWIATQPFSMSDCSLTFGLTGLATTAIRLAGHGADTSFLALAAATFVITNFIVGGIALRTV